MVKMTEKMLEDLRREFQELKLDDPKDLNAYEYVREKVYTEFREAVDASTAYSYLLLILDIEQHIEIKNPSFAFYLQLRSANNKYYFITKFSLQSQSRLENEIAEWAANFLKPFDFEEVKRENQQWKTLNPDRIRQIGSLRNILAFIHDKQDLVSEISKSYPELEQWLAFRKELLK